MSSGRAARILLVVALTVAAALLVLLARDHRDLAGRYAELRERSLNPHPGVVVPTFRTEGLEGESLVVGDPDPGSVQALLFFTTRCPYSRASIPRWRALHRASREAAQPFRVIGVALDSMEAVRPYAEEHRLPYPVTTLPERKLASLYRVRRVPLLVVVDEQGRMLHARTGAMESQAAVDSVLVAVREGRALAALETGAAGTDAAPRAAPRSTAVPEFTDEP